MIQIFFAGFIIHHFFAIEINSNECDCSYPIYYFDLSNTYEAPCTLPDTVMWEENGMRNVLIITDCGGSGSFTVTDIPKNKITYTSIYQATPLSVDSIYRYDENTFTESLEITELYKPDRIEVKY